MSNNVIILQDDCFHFPLERGSVTGNGRSIYSVDNLFTPHGFIIPYWRASFNLLDLIEGREFNGDDPISGDLGMLVTMDGLVYAFRQDKDLGQVVISRTRVPTGKGAYVAMCFPSAVESGVTMAMHLCDRRVEPALDLLNKVFCIRRDAYVSISIPDIVKGLEERGYNNPQALNKPTRYEFQRDRSF